MNYHELQTRCCKPVGVHPTRRDFLPTWHQHRQTFLLAFTLVYRYELYRLKMSTQNEFSFPFFKFKSKVDRNRVRPTSPSDHNTSLVISWGAPPAPPHKTKTKAKERNKEKKNKAASSHSSLLQKTATFKLPTGDTESFNVKRLRLQ
jgi:hypothetical protein